MASPVDARYAQLPQAEQEQAPVSCINRYRGYIFSFLTALFFAISNVLVQKAPLLNGSDHLVVLFTINLISMFFVACFQRVNIFGPSGARFLLVTRGLFGVLAVAFLYIALVLIPPSDVAAISHTSIIITAILARILLKEKLGIVHLLSLCLTITGVVFISKPSVFFPVKASPNETSTVEAEANSGSSFGALDKFTVGLMCMIIAAFLFGVLQVVLKSLCNVKVHWSVSTIYIAYFGLPICVASSVLLIYFGFAHRTFTNFKALQVNVAFSGASAVMAILGQCSLNIALNYEDATKVSILKTIDVFIAFVLQFFILNIRLDVFSVLGSLAILVGTFLVMAFKGLEASYEKKTKRSAFGKLIMFKF
jgi:drug/metabolite transporter (DMT)-like permease